MRHLSLSLLFLAFASTSLFAFNKQIVTIPASAMKGSYPATVIMPDSYSKSEQRYPVIYLLHGYGGDYKEQG